MRSCRHQLSTAPRASSWAGPWKRPSSRSVPAVPAGEASVGERDASTAQQLVDAVEGDADVFDIDRGLGAFGAKRAL